MKTSNIFNKINFLLLMVAVLSGCNQSEDAIRIPSNSDCLIHAQLEKTAQSRSWINFEGEMSWSEADYLGVYGEESQNIPFHYSSQLSEDGFSGNLDTREENIVFSYFPYNEKAQLKGQNLSFLIPEVSDYTSENESPMIGLPISNHTLQFKQLGGIFYLRMIGIPDDAALLTVESVGANKKYLSGTLNVKDVNQENAIFTFTQGSYKRSFNIQQLAGSSKMHELYIPLEVGKYSKLELSVWNSKHEKICTKSVSNLEVSRAHLVNTPVIHFSDKIYYCQIPKEVFKDTKINQAVYLSNDLIITSELTENEDRILRVQKNVRSGEMTPYQLIATIDKAGEVKCLSVKDNYVWMNDDGSILCIEGEQVDLIKNTTSMALHKTRIGVEESHFWQDLSGVLSFIDKLDKFGKGKIKEILIDMAIDQMKESIDYDKIVEQQFDGFLNPDNFDSIVSFLVYMENCSNKEAKHQYEKFCGNVTVQTNKPSIHGNKINCGYRISGTNTIGASYDKYKPWHTCGLLVVKIPTGAGPIVEPTLKTANAIVLGKNDLTGDRSFVCAIEFERGYTYYFRSFVAVLGNDVANYPICYYGKTEKINASNVKIDSVTFKDAKVNGTNIDFLGSAKVSFQGQSSTFKYGIVVYRNGKEYRTFFPTGTPNVATIDFNFGAIWTTEHLDLDINAKEYRASTKGHWQLGTIMVFYTSDGQVDQYIYNDDLVDIDFVYNKKPRVRFIKANILGTELIKSSKQARTGVYDNSDDDRYVTTFSCQIEVESSLWIAKLIMHSTGFGSTLIKDAVYADGVYTLKSQLVYSENTIISPVISIEIGTVTLDHIFSENVLRLGGGSPMTTISIENWNN